MFRRQLIHQSISTILDSVKRYTITHDIVRCPDGHFRRAIYIIGPYMADYPEQCVLACIVQGWCPRFVFTLSLHNLCTNMYIVRCTAEPPDLDFDTHANHRSRTHREEMADLFSTTELWKGYGIVAEVVVSFR